MALRAKIRQNAAPLLEPGEKIQAVIPAQLNQPGPRAGIARKIILIATDRRILVCAGALLRRSTVGRVLTELPRETQIGPTHGTVAHEFHVPGVEFVPIWIPWRFFKDVAQADAARTGSDAPW